jgi:hypothetical protein
VNHQETPLIHDKVYELTVAKPAGKDEKKIKKVEEIAEKSQLVRCC